MPYKDPEKAKAYRKAYRKANRDRILAYDRLYYYKNRKEKLVKQKAWYEANKEKKIAYQQAYSRAHRQHIIEHKKEYYKENRSMILEYHKNQRRNNPVYKISSDMRSATWRSLRGNKKSPWESLVDYTLNQLKEHLEKQFQPGMTWQNYGKWHVDHIIPISLWKFEKPEDREFQQCWALANLQPLWAEENLKKGNRI